MSERERADFCRRRCYAHNLRKTTDDQHFAAVFAQFLVSKKCAVIVSARAHATDALDVCGFYERARLRLYFFVVAKLPDCKFFFAKHSGGFFSYKLTIHN